METRVVSAVLTCQQCKNAFTPKATKNPRRRQPKFCSFTCANVFRSPNRNLSGERRCAGCKEVKRLEAFPVSRGTPLDRGYTCAACCGRKIKVTRDADVDAARARDREKYNSNKLAANLRSKKWKLKNSDRLRKYNAAWAEANPGYFTGKAKQWVIDHRPEKRLRDKARRALRAGAEVAPFTVADWESVLECFDRRCAFCLCQLSDGNLSQDHFVPLARGGDHSESNVIPACLRCNNRKGARLMTHWVPALVG